MPTMGLVWAASCAAALLGQEQEPGAVEAPPKTAVPVRPQQLEAGYRHNLAYPEHIDRENIASGAMGAMDVFHLALQDAGDDHALARVLKWGLAGWLDGSVLYVAHEYGHLSTISKTGSRDAVSGELGGSMHPTSPFSLFLDGLRFPTTKLISVSESDWKEIERMFAGHPEDRERFLAMMEAGGLNQEEIIADRYARRLLDGQMSYLDTIPYFWNRIGTLMYRTSIEESDINDYVGHLKAQGLETSAGRIKAFSAVGLLSGSAVAAARGTLAGFGGRSEGLLDPLTWKVGEESWIAWPEIDSFLSQVGPTLGATVPARLGPMELFPRYERVFAGGGDRDEWGLQAEVQVFRFLSLDGSTFVAYGSGRWHEAYAALRPFAWLSLTAGFAWGRGYTIHRDVFGAGNDLLEEEEASPILGLAVSHRF
jgi:hypothetical protein